MASLGGEPGGDIGKKPEASDDKLTMRAVNEVLDTFQSLRSEKYTFNRMPVRGLIELVLKNNNVDEKRAKALVEPVFDALKAYDEPGLQEQIRLEEKFDSIASGVYEALREHRPPEETYSLIRGGLQSQGIDADAPANINSVWHLVASRLDPDKRAAIERHLPTL